MGRRGVGCVGMPGQCGLEHAMVKTTPDTASSGTATGSVPDRARTAQHDERGERPMPTAHGSLVLTCCPAELGGDRRRDHVVQRNPHEVG